MHQNIKYGDIIYFEYYNHTKQSRILLTSSGFELNQKSYVDTKKIVLTGDSIYLKDFEDNLFVLFPTMNDDFLTHKAILDETIRQIIPKIEIAKSSIDDISTKKDINTIIQTYQEAKKDVYSENEKLIKQIGTPIKFGDTFILIHFKSQMFVTKYDLDSISNQKKNKLILTDYYTEDCIFLFSPYNNYDKADDFVFSNQNVFIRKKERNMWANNQYLKIKTVLLSNEEDLRKSLAANIKVNSINNNNDNTSIHNKNENVKYLLTFTEDQNNANAFQIKICSNYIDPSSSSLSFATPVWISCQNLNKILIITPNNKDKDPNEEDVIIEDPIPLSNKLNPTEPPGTEISLKEKEWKNHFKPSYTIAFANIDREKTMNNIYGLFIIEQIENERNYALNDQYLKNQMINNLELRISPCIEYNKKIRFRHVATKKYLGLEEKGEVKAGNICANLILEDIPNDKCDWVFMESYKIIDRAKYLKEKEEGIKGFSNKYHIKDPNQLSNKILSVNKKEILRIFHLKSQKFLSFFDLPSKLISDFDDQQFNVKSLSLKKSPYDWDLVRLMPSNENQSWEIHLVLYFNSVLCKQISYCSKIDMHKFYKYIGLDYGGNGQLETIIEDNNEKISSLKLKNDLSNEKENQEKFAERELIQLKSNATELRMCFENLRDFCLNKFSRRFDITASAGKPVFYRQEFLYDQGFLDKTFQFLSKAKIFDYQQYLNLAEQSLKHHPKAGNSKNGSVMGDSERLSRQSTKIKVKLKQQNKNLLLIGDFFKEINLCVTRSFEFISAMCKNHYKNKEYVFRHRSIFSDYLLIYKEASGCLIDIIKDDENFMNEIIKETVNNCEKEEKENDSSKDSTLNIIETIINDLNDNEKYDLHTLSLLSKLMKSKDKGITSNQEYIFNAIFEAKKDKFLLKIAPQYNDTIFHVVYKNEMNHFVSRNLFELTATKNSFSEYEKDLVRYLSEELNLFANLCYGRNYVCIEKIRTIFPLDHLIYHIANVEIHEEILSGLINILNYVYIDIEPHVITIYPAIIKIVTSNLKVEKINRISIKTYIPLDKLRLILCISLYWLNNICYGKLLANAANINLIYNLIQFRLYENVEYKQENVPEVINSQLDRTLRNLKEEVKNLIIKGENLLLTSLHHQFSPNENKKGDKKEKDDDKRNVVINKSETFFDKIGYKFLEFDFENEIGSEYLIFVIDNINDFFLEKVIIDNIDANMQNKNIIAQTFKTVNKTDMLTQNNINYLMKVLIQIKGILTSGNSKKIYSSSIDLSDRGKVFLPIVKQIAKILDFILNIKKEDMIDKILENLMRENKKVVKGILDNYLENEKDNQTQKKKKIGIFDLCLEEFSKKVNFKEVMLENEYYLYQLFNELNPFIEDSYEEDEKFFKNLIHKTKKANNKISNSENAALVNKEEKVNYIAKLFTGETSHQNEYLNSMVFKTLQELIIRILEVNVDERMTKILVKLFTRLHSQRKEIIGSIKNIRILYGEKDLRKYFQCRKLIRKLALLTEKTEIWMNPDKIPLDKLQTKKSFDLKTTWEIEPHDESNEENFENVIRDLKSLIMMCYRKKAVNLYKKKDKLKLIQTIFFSFKLDDVLYSLIREISQVFPVNEEKDEKYFKKSLEILLKQIFKLLICMVHNNSNVQTQMKDLFSFCQAFHYLNDLGFINLITQVVSKSETFTNENIKYIMDIIMNEFNFKTFEITFKGYDKEENNGVGKKEYDKEVKKCVQILYLVKSTLTKIKDTKYLNIIINNFEEIMQNCPLFINQNIENIENENDLNSIEVNKSKVEKDIYDENENIKYLKLKSKTENYKMEVLNYLIKIGSQLLRINEKLKEFILKLFPMQILKEKVLKKTLPIDASTLERFLDSSIKNTRESFKLKSIIENKLRTFYKLKYNGFVLFTMIANDFHRFKGHNYNIKSFFVILSQDLDKFFEVDNVLEKNFGNDLYIAKMWKKYAYRYLFRGIFPIVYQLSNYYIKELLKSGETYNLELFSYREIVKKWKKVFLEMIGKKENYEFFFSILSYVEANKESFSSFFDNFSLFLLLNNKNNEPKVDLLFQEYIENRSKNDNDKNKNDEIIKKKRKILKRQLSIVFTEDFIYRIENNKKINKYVEKESKILAKNLKSKINFHQVMQKFINEHSANTFVYEMLYDRENNFHLLNIFIKFIQENYLSTKYYPQIKFLIELFSYFIEVKPLFLKADNSNLLKSNYFFSKKVEELKENFLIHCQKLFLNNGSVEVFLKIICEGNKKFNNDIFPSVLNFFNNVLDGGNKLSQQKFYQLFIFFPNSDNLFYYIKQLFYYDIYQNLPNDISIKNPKIDNKNQMTMTHLLRFLQLLTENHFTDLQVYLRDQTSNRISYNFITILVDYINMLLGKLSNIHEENQKLTKYATELYYRRLLAVLETLCEFLQGPCKTNQETLVNSKIIELFDKILRETEILDSTGISQGLQQSDEIENEGDSKDNINKNQESDKTIIQKKMSVEGENLEDKDDEVEIELQENFVKDKKEFEKSKFMQMNKLFYFLTDYEKSLLIYKIGLVLLAIIEGRKVKDEVIKKILRDFDYKLIFEQINYIYLKLKTKMEFFLYAKEIEDFDKENNKKVVAEAGFNLYFFLISLYSMETEETEFKKFSNLVFKEQHKLSKIERESLTEISPSFSSIQCAMLFFKENSLNIEIIKEDQVLRVFCPKLTFFRNYTQEMLKNFQEKANRTSIQTKLNSLLGEKNELYQTLKQLYNLEEFFKKSGPFQFLFMFPRIIELICLVLGIIINIFIFIGFNVDNDEDQLDLMKNVRIFGMTKNSSVKVLTVIGAVLLVFSALIFTEFLTRRAPIIYRRIYVSILSYIIFYS